MNLNQRRPLSHTINPVDRQNKKDVEYLLLPTTFRLSKVKYNKGEWNEHTKWYIVKQGDLTMLEGELLYLVDTVMKGERMDWNRAFNVIQDKLYEIGELK